MDGILSLTKTLFSSAHSFGTVPAEFGVSGKRRWLFTSNGGSSEYRLTALKKQCTAVALLRHMRLDPDVHHVYIMGTLPPQRGFVGSLVSSDALDLWSFVDADATHLYVRVEALPLDGGDIDALRSDADGKLTAHLRARPRLLKETLRLQYHQAHEVGHRLCPLHFARLRCSTCLSPSATACASGCMASAPAAWQTRRAEAADGRSLDSADLSRHHML